MCDAKGLFVVVAWWATCFATLGAAEFDHKMFQAIRRGDDALVRGFLRQGTSAKLRSPDGTTLLMVAALHGTPQSVEALLEHGANANAANDDGITPLIWAAGSEAKVRTLLQHGADVNARSALGNTPLLVASAFRGNANVVRRLLEKGAQAYVTNQQNTDPLAHAVVTGDLECVRLLLRQGNADVIEKSIKRQNLLSSAAEFGWTDVAKTLLEHADVVNQSDRFPGGHAIHSAMAGGHVELATYFLEQGSDLTTRLRIGNVPTLFLATYNDTGDSSLIHRMLEQGADGSKLNSRGESALTWARRRGDPGMIRLLKQAGVPDPEDAMPEIPQRNLNLHAGNLQSTLRAAVQKSLRLMQTSSDRFLDNRKTCVSCHHQNLTGVAIGWARDRGFAVDQASVNRMVSRQMRRWNGHVERAYQMDRPVPVPGRFLGWGMWGLSALGQPQDEAIEAAVWYLAAIQQPEGRWSDGFLRPPMGGGDVVSTVLSMRALQLYPLATHHGLAGRIQRAATWLAQRQPRYHQERVFKILGLGWAGTPTQALRDDVARLMEAQNDDGGWSQLEHLPSDAWATGQALVALHIAGGLETTHPQYRRGVEFLLSTQFDDGAWFVKGRSFPFQPEFDSGFPFGHDQWVSIGGTAWATMALVLATHSSPAVVSRRGDSVDVVVEATKLLSPKDEPANVTVSFKTDVLPVLKRSCLGCHSGDNPEANLLLTERHHLIRGGDSGDPALVPGDRQRSALFVYISGADPELQMPPSDERETYPALTKEEVAKIGAWIDQGAKWERSP